MTSILSTFHPFLTLPNKTLKRQKGILFSGWSDLFKSAKKVPFFQFEAISSKAWKRYLFCDLETFLSKEQKRHFFAVTSNLIKSTKKVPLKINDVSIKVPLIDSRQATVGAPNERYTDVFRGRYVPFLQSNFAVPNLTKKSKTHPRLPYKHLYGRLFLNGPS